MVKIAFSLLLSMTSVHVHFHLPLSLFLVYIVCKTEQAADIMKEFAAATGTLSRCGE